MTFNEVREYLATVPFINNGGCGIAAYAMYLWLKENDQLSNEFKFVLLYCYSDDEIYENNSQVLKNKDGKAIACAHVGIFNGDTTVDSDGEINVPGYRHVQFVSDEWFLINMINNIPTWNRKFDRGCIKSIEKKLGIEIVLKEETKLLRERVKEYFII